MLTLLIGDLHIPERLIEIPAKFRKLLAPNPNQYPSNNKISKVICLGNVTNSSETLKFLYGLSPSFHIVRGECDDVVILSQQVLELNKESKEYQVPFHQTITNDNLKIGFTNGYQVVPKNDPLALLTLARELDVDILVWGGTHKVEAYTLDGKFFINPGSATGAFSFDWPEDEAEEEEEETEETEETEVEKVEKAPEEKLNSESKDTETESEPDSETKEPEDEPENASKEEEGSKDEKESVTESSDELDEAFLDELSEISSSIPSFCLLDAQGSKCTLYIYTYINDEVKVDKVTYQKE